MKTTNFNLRAVILAAILTVLSVGLFGTLMMQDEPRTITQPDGVSMIVYESGNFYYFRTYDKNDYTMIIDSDTGYWCWAYLSEDGHDLLSTGKPVHLFDPKKLGIEPGLDKSNARQLQIFWIWRHGIKIELEDIEKGVTPDTIRRSRQNNSPQGWYCPPTGTIRNLVFFVRFSDQSEFTTRRSVYDRMFNSTRTNANSLYRYFRDSSYNTLDVYSTFYTVQTASNVISYQDTRTVF